MWVKSAIANFRLYWTFIGLSLAFPNPPKFFKIFSMFLIQLFLQAIFIHYSPIANMISVSHTISSPTRAIPFPLPIGPFTRTISTSK